VNAFVAVLRKDLLRKARSPLATVVMLLFPVVFSLLIGVTFGAKGDKVAPIRIALVDEDQGILARLVRSSFTQDQGAERFDVQVTDMKTALRLVENDKVSAVLRVPPGFSDSVLAERPSSLALIKNPAQSIYPTIAEQYVKVLAQVGGSAVRILGPPVREIREATRRDEAPADLLVSRIAVAINRRLGTIGRYVLPPAIRLEEPKPPGAEDKDEAESPFRVAVFVLPGMAVFALLMLALVSMSDFQREGAHGTLARQFVAPVPFRAVVLGKVGATWLLSLACILILALLAGVWARVRVSAAGFAALSIAFAFAATGFAALVQSLSRTERAGSAIGTILVMIMSLVGGSFVPYEALPALAQRIAHFTLNYWGSQGYRDLLFSSAGLSDLGPNLAVLAGFGLLFCVVAILRFTRRYGTGD
jgi:ABC-2 type transport system permease protein